MATIRAVSPNISPKELYDCLLRHRYFEGLSYEQLMQIAEQGFFTQDAPGRSSADCEFFQSFLAWPEQKVPLSPDEVADALRPDPLFKDKTEEELKHCAVHGVWPRAFSGQPRARPAQ
jgi:hypothetical protein